LFSTADKFKQQYFIGMIPAGEEKAQAQANLDQTLEYGTLTNCRRKFLLQYFNEDYTEDNCSNCDQCVAFDPLPPPTANKKAQATSMKPGISAVDSDDYDPDLFEVLRQVRTKEAARLKVPPYIVFGDKALRDMAHNKPQTDAEFLKINGVGDKKLKKFGAVFMEAIEEYG
jgi:ATP-dependent DNA helicase RecQ